MHWFLGIALGLLCSACLVSSQGALVLPSKTSVGTVSMTSENASAVGTRVSSAFSWASAAPAPDNGLDVAVGYQADAFASYPPVVSPIVVARRTGETPAVMSGVQSPESAASPLFHGPFLEVGGKLKTIKRTRHWLAARLELPMRTVGSETSVGVGAAVHYSAELYAHTDRDSAIGVLALGCYAEAGARRLANGVPALVSSAGLLVRLPMVAVR